MTDFPYFFKKITHAAYKTVGDAVDYAVEADAETGTLYVIFQCSRQDADWRVNFNFWPKSMRIMINDKPDKIHVHGGFLRAWNSAEAHVLLDVQKALNDTPCNSIVVLGWSYGGAMAYPASISLNRYFGQPIGIITFGAPNFFLGKKSADKTEKLFRLTVNISCVNDITTMVPPWPYCMNGRLKVGGKFKFFQLFHPEIWHQDYDNADWYLG